MDTDEIINWIAYDKINPFPNLYNMHGTLCTLICRFAGDKNAKPEDFIPQFQEKEKVLQIEDIKSIFRGISGSSSN